MEKKYAGQFAVITGASTGIGYELAKQFAEHGFDILITSKDPMHIEDARRTLQEFDVQVETFAADLATYEGIEALYHKIKSTGRPLDAIAINAGVGNYGEFKDTDLDDDYTVIDLNIACPVHLSKRVIRDMVARGRGKILFTASIAGTMPGPLMSVYNASKAFLLSFSYALREELKDKGVSVTALLPGATDTKFFKRAHMEHTKIGKMKKQPPSEVAEAGFKALMDNEADVISGIGNKIQTAIGEILPETFKARKEHQQAKPDQQSTH